ncbi:MAG: hypothetical protein KA314_13445 [Chloroflexi bacterium]|nr:hypothetical protein [Chloroflexota bacterium]
MFDPEEFFTGVDGQEQSTMSKTVGGIGSWLLHLVKVMFLLYAMSHGISASLAYAGNHWWAQAAQIVGIVVTGIVLFGLYLLFMNRKIQGARQMIAAAAVYAIGFILECLAIVADSQLNAGQGLSSWLVAYLLWVLPVAPAIMGLGAVIVHALEPEQGRAREQAEQKRQLEDERFNALLDQERAKLNEARAIRAMQGSSRQAVIKQLGNVYASDQVQQAIMQTALANMPALLRAAGIQFDRGLSLAAGDEDDIEDDDLDLHELVDLLVSERLEAERRKNQASEKGSPDAAALAGFTNGKGAP